MIFVIGGTSGPMIWYQESKPFFTQKWCENNICECKSNIITKSFLNPIFSSKPAIINVEKKTNEELFNELTIYLNDKNDVNITKKHVLQYIVKYICDNKNKNNEYLYVKYCNSCTNMYNLSVLIKKQFWGITYFSYNKIEKIKLIYKENEDEDFKCSFYESTTINSIYTL